MAKSRLLSIQNWFVICCLLCSFSLLVTVSAQEVASEGVKATSLLALEPLDIFKLEFASDPRISPDGKSIVYVRNHFDIMTDRRRQHLWMLDSKNEHFPLLSNPLNASSPRWSPDGKKVAFISADEHGKNQIFCHWLKPGKTASISMLPESPGNLQWSPDGKWLSFVMNVPAKNEEFVSPPPKPKGAVWAEQPMVITSLKYRSDGGGYLKLGHAHLFVIPADGGAAHQLTTGDFQHRGRYCWAPEGKAIVFSANRQVDADFSPRNTDLFEVSIESGDISQLTTRNGEDGNPAISADGKLIAYTGSDDKLLGHQNALLHVMNRDGSNARLIETNIDRSLSNLRWVESRNGFVFTFSDQGNTKLGLWQPSGKTKILAANLGSNAIGRPYGGSGEVSSSRDGKLVFAVTTPKQPGEVTLLEPGQEARCVTRLNNDVLARRELGEVTEIRFTSSHDAKKLQGWVIKPPAFDPKKKYPMILEIHGGPFADYGDRFSAELQLYAAAGYVVLYMNPRGSTSYGQQFTDLIHHNYPGNDYDDLMSGVDAVIEEGYVDSDKLFVTGGSGGGVLSAWIVGKTNRFKAAVVVKPVINWYSFALTADAYNYFYKYWFPGFPWDHQEEYMKRSPISLVGKVNTPTMLMTGVVDYRTPMSETEQYYQALQLRKIDSALVRIPGASHGISARPSHLIAKVRHVLQWFERFNNP